MPQDAKLLAITQAIGADIKALEIARGNLAALNTAAKSNLVAAINEVFALIGGVAINDAAGDGVVDQTWSANKIYDEITARIDALRNELRAGAGAALDTFAEVAAQLAADESAAAALATAVSNRVRFDAAQVLTGPQQLQACQNLGIGDPEQDLLGAYNAAKA